MARFGRAFPSSRYYQPKPLAVFAQNTGVAAGTGTAYDATITAIEYQRPISDIATGSWTVVPLWSKVNEVTIDDSNLITSETLVAPGNTSNADLRLTARGDPLSSTGQIISVRAKVTFTLGLNGGIRGELRQGSGVTSALIATLTTDALTTSFVTYTYTLSGAEADSITDYGDLFLRLYGNFPIGSLGGVTVSWVQFQQPAGITPDTSVYPDAAAGTGAANTPAASIAPHGGLSSGTGAAGNAAGSVSANSGAATGTGAAGSPAGSLNINVGNASGTGTAGAPSASVAVNAGLCSGTGQAFNATPTPSSTAGVASGTGSAGNAAGSVAGSSGAATGTGVAGAPVGTIVVDPGIATGIGGSNTGAISVAVGAGAGAGAGAAYDAIAIATGAAHGGLAAGTGTAYGISVSITTTAGVAAGSGAAFNVTITIVLPPAIRLVVNVRLGASSATARGSRPSVGANGARGSVNARGLPSSVSARPVASTLVEQQ